jgi:hypothetical protein
VLIPVLNSIIRVKNFLARHKTGSSLLVSYSFTNKYVPTAKQDRQCTYNATMRRVHETIVAMEGSITYFCVRVRVGERYEYACLRACVRVCVCFGGWVLVHERGRELARV